MNQTWKGYRSPRLMELLTFVFHFYMKLILIYPSILGTFFLTYKIAKYLNGPWSHSPRPLVILSMINYIYGLREYSL